MENFELLHRDQSLVAYDKPPGLLTVPGRGSAPSLWRLAEEQLEVKLFAVHRLDRETSGVVLFALSAEAHRWLSAAFERREVEKRYRALVAPPPVPAVGQLSHRLTSARRGFMRLVHAGEAGREALTDYRTLRLDPSGHALLEVVPHTGRTHQIRLQLAEAGSPIVGEPHYRKLGGVRATVGTRLWLHAHTLEFEHPTLRERLRLEAPPPAELRLD